VLTLTVYTRHLIDESFKKFETGLDYNNPNHTLQHTPSEGLKYVGPPGPEIDAAWDAIAGSKLSQAMMTITNAAKLKKHL
jgi:hypothetical protein